MSYLRKARRTRLRLAAVVGITLITAGAGYDIISTPPAYLESATVMFALPKADNSPNAYYKFVTSGITSGEAMVQVLMSPQGQRQIRLAGGTASVNIALVNLYSEQYPDYGVPLATLTTVSPSAENTHRTFMIAVQRLGTLLAVRQKEVGVTARNRISTEVIADTGPTVRAGSVKRVLAGLAVLALVAVGALWSLVDRIAPARNPAVAVRLTPKT